MDRSLMATARLARAPWRFIAFALVAAACGRSPGKSPPGPGSDAAGQRGDTTVGGPDASTPTDAAGDGQPPSDAPAQTDAPVTPTPDAGVDAPLADADAPPADAGATQDASSDAASSADGAAGLSQALTRTWIGPGPLGNCINESSWYTFGADGTVVERDIDDNDCTHVPRLLATIPGSYTLTGRLLELTMSGRGLDSGSLGFMSPTAQKVTKRLERSPVLVATVTPPWIGAGHLALDHRAYTSDDGARFQSERYARLDAATGRLFEQSTLHAITIDPPLPLAAGTPCTVTVDVSVTSFDAGSNPTSESGTFHVSYAAIIRATEPGWLRVLPQKIDGLASTDANSAWQGILDAAGFSQRTLRFRSAAGMSYYLGHPVDDARVLSEQLPQWGHWREALKALPVQ
jgi:hypothetical protein